MEFLNSSFQLTVAVQHKQEFGQKAHRPVGSRPPHWECALLQLELVTIN